MATDQDFIKKEAKYASGIEKFMVWLVPLAVIAIGVIATLYLFVFKPKEPCDPIDKVGAWCRVHPTTGWDITGLILFYCGVLWLSSILPRLFIAFGWLEDDSAKFPAFKVLAGIAAIGGFAIMYAV
jgi:hypothetical protein